MKKYIIDDLQGGNFCSWSYSDPPTRAQIIAHFNEFRIIENMDFQKKALNLRFIANFWQVAINPA